MRKNLYTKTINDIKISENAVNSAIENIYSKQSNDNIIDIKKNKKVNIQDLMKLMYYISGMTDLNENSSANSDINKDGKINIQDLMRLMYYISGKITEL